MKIISQNHIKINIKKLDARKTYSKKRQRRNFINVDLVVPKLMIEKLRNAY